MDQISIINKEYIFITEHSLAPVVYSSWTTISWLGRSGVVYDQKGKATFLSTNLIQRHTVFFQHNTDNSQFRYPTLIKVPVCCVIRDWLKTYGVTFVPKLEPTLVCFLDFAENNSVLVLSDEISLSHSLAEWTKKCLINLIQ